MSLHDTLNGVTTPAVPDPEAPRICAAVTVKGALCRRYAVEGSSVCVLHGGSIPASQEQVLRNLLALQEVAIHALREVFATADAKVIADAAFKLLDRTGHGPSSTVQVKKDTTDYSHLSLDEIARELDALAEQAREVLLTRPVDARRTTH